MATRHAPPAPKQERSELSTGRLLDAAAELIAEGGYERMTLTGIGERAGYSPGLVTARFGSKEGLLSTLVDRMTFQWAERVLAPALGEAAGAEAIHAMLVELQASWRLHPAQMRALYILMFESLLPVPWLREHVTRLHRELRSACTRAIERGVEQGTVSAAVDAAAVSQLVVGAVRGAVYQSLLDPRGVPLRGALANVHLLVDALLPATAG